MPEKKIERLLILQRDLALALNSSLSAGESYEKILDALLQIDPVDSGGIFEFDEEMDLLQLQAYRGLQPGTVKMFETISCGQKQYRFIKHGKVFYRDHVDVDPVQGDVIINEGIRALAVIPVSRQGRVVAALFIASHRDASFPDMVRTTVESVAAQLGSVIRDIRDRAAVYENEKNLLSLFNSIDDMIFILDSSGNILEVNEPVLRKLGYSMDELRMKSVLELHPQSRRNEAARVLKKMISGRERMCHIPVQSKNGRHIQVETNIAPGIWSGRPAFFGMTRDVSERVALERKISESNVRLELALKAANLGTWDWNIATGEVIFNERWAAMLGYTLDELKPHVSTWERLVHPDDMALIMAELNKHLAGLIPLYRSEHRLKTKDGSWKWVLDTGRVFMRTGDGAPLRAAGVHVDITDEKNVEEMLREISIRDPLTNIYNRRYIFERLHFMISKSRRNGDSLAVAIADIDFFKRINDTHGHMAGDSVLIDFSRVLAARVREYDLLGRYGGEEFIILFDESTSAQAVEIMERIRHDVSAMEFRLKTGDAVKLTLSCGISQTADIAEDELNSDSLVELADRRLYIAKEKGRNLVVYS